MGIVTVLVDNIAKGQEIQLLQTTLAGDVDWEEDGPCDEATDQAGSASDFEIAEEQEAIE